LLWSYALTRNEAVTLFDPAQIWTVKSSGLPS
jgi:hypothetical protein